AADRYGLRLIGHVPETLHYEEALVPDVQHLMGITPPSAHRRTPLIDGWRDVDDTRLEAIVTATVQHGIANTPTLVLGDRLLLYGRYTEATASPEAQLMPRLYRDVVWNPTTGIETYRNLTADELSTLAIAQAKKSALVRRLYDAGAQLYLGTDVQQPFV